MLFERCVHVTGNEDALSSTLVFVLVVLDVCVLSDIVVIVRQVHELLLLIGNQIHERLDR